MGELGDWVRGHGVGRACAVGAVEMGAVVAGEKSIREWRVGRGDGLMCVIAFNICRGKGRGRVVGGAAKY